MRYPRAAVAVLPLLIVVLAGLSIAPAPSPAASPNITRGYGVYVHPQDFDFSTLLVGPPPDDSQAHRVEIAHMLYEQNRRTAQDVARCIDESNHVNVWLFADVLGDDFNPTSHPLTKALFDEIHANAKPVVDAAKAKWNRLRPYRTDERIHPCVHLETGGSFPSGHATLAMIWATALSEIFPAQRDALMARGRQIGSDRAMAGVHYPSDVAAGQKLGAEIARRLLANRDFRIELDSVRRECGQPMPAVAIAPSSEPTTSAATQP